MKRFTFILVVLFLSFQSCYDFNGTVISNGASTFNVQQFQISDADTYPSYEQDLMDDLTREILSNSRLSYSNQSPDIEFKGNITTWDRTAEAAVEDNTADLNRLTIVVKIELINNIEPKNGWVEEVREYADYSSALDFETVREELLEEINEQLVDEIFRLAFRQNW